MPPGPPCARAVAELFLLMLSQDDGGTSRRRPIPCPRSAPRPLSWNYIRTRGRIGLQCRHKGRRIPEWRKCRQPRWK